MSPIRLDIDEKRLNVDLTEAGVLGEGAFAVTYRAKLGALDVVVKVQHAITGTVLVTLTSVSAYCV